MSRLIFGLGKACRKTKIAQWDVSLAMLEESGNTEKALAAYRAAQDIHPHLDGVAEAIQRLEAQETGQEL